MAEGRRELKSGSRESGEREARRLLRLRRRLRLRLDGSVRLGGGGGWSHGWSLSPGRGDSAVSVELLELVWQWCVEFSGERLAAASALEPRRCRRLRRGGRRGGQNHHARPSVPSDPLSAHAHAHAGHGHADAPGVHLRTASTLRSSCVRQPDPPPALRWLRARCDVRRPAASQPAVCELAAPKLRTQHSDSRHDLQHQSLLAPVPRLHAGKRHLTSQSACATSQGEALRP